MDGVGNAPVSQLRTVSGISPLLARGASCGAGHDLSRFRLAQSDDGEGKRTRIPGEAGALRHNVGPGRSCGLYLPDRRFRISGGHVSVRDVPGEGRGTGEMAAGTDGRGGYNSRTLHYFPNIVEDYFALEHARVLV